MERYIVLLKTDTNDRPLQFLIPLPQGSPVSALKTQVQRRAAKIPAFSAVADQEITLRLESEDGPLLDDDDLLQDVTVGDGDAKGGRIFAASGSAGGDTNGVVVQTSQSIPQTHSHQTLGPQGHAKSTQPDSVPGIKIRVITPCLAQAHEDVNTIPLLHGGAPVPLSTTLWDLRSRIANSLGVTLDEASLPLHHECNCAFARKINDHGIWKKIDCCGHDAQNPTSCAFELSGGQDLVRSVCAACSIPVAGHQTGGSEQASLDGDQCSAKLFLRTDAGCRHVLHSECAQSKAWKCPQDCRDSILDSTHVASYPFTVVHGQSIVQRLTSRGPSKTHMLESLREKFGRDFDDSKFVGYAGLLTASEHSYLSMPVVSICSRQRHISDDQSIAQSTNHEHGRPGTKTVALSTIEVPIEIRDATLTIEEAHLQDLKINDVLNIYTVEEHPQARTPRGKAAFLASLRVFVHRIGSKEMSEVEQDAILSMMHRLTRFPPAVLATYTLMQGSNPHPSQCAALLQTLQESLKTFSYLGTMLEENGRVLEASRLIFGYIIAKAKQQASIKSDSTPYLSAIRTIDLLNPNTNQPISKPVSTSVGLLESAYFEAYREGGLLSWNNGNHPPTEELPDLYAQRIARLSGACFFEVRAFDIHQLIGESWRKRTSMSAAEAHDRSLIGLEHLASLCEDSGLGVTAPSNLPQSEAPTLTLDRDGCLAVYVGREACGVAGKDIIMFRPLLGDESVDVAIITQLIAPILRIRARDGSHCFDCYGGGLKRKERHPEEIILFCVDCSRSMEQSSDFDELKVEEDQHDGRFSGEDSLDDEDLVNEIRESYVPHGDSCGNLESSDSYRWIKDWTSNYESFKDILAIIQNTGRLNKQAVASRILVFVVRLCLREAASLKEQGKDLKTWAPSKLAGQRLTGDHQRIEELEKILLRICHYKLALCDYLVYCATTTRPVLRDWKWDINDELPQPSEYVPSTATATYEAFFIPPACLTEFLCPISQEIFEDPVNASDGFTYERKSIERWFQMRKSSPSTGLLLTDTSVRRNGPLAVSIKKWISGENIIDPVLAPRRRRLAREEPPSSAILIDVEFEKEGATFRRKLPKSLSTAQLHKYAFQGIRGSQSQFYLMFGDKILPASNVTIESEGLTNRCRIHILSDHCRRIEDESKNGEACQIIVPREVFLIRAFSEESMYKPLFSFWNTRNNTASFASLVFRYLRYKSEKGKVDLEQCDVDVWVGLNYAGDSRLTGKMHILWEKLHTGSTVAQSIGQLEKDKAYEMDADDSPPEDDVPSDSKFEVLKIVFYPHVSKAASDRLCKERERRMSRLDTAKHIFDTFINRTLAYNLTTHIGLVTFSSTATISQLITHAIEDFRISLEGMTAQGDTALWDAIALANDQLTQYSRKFPSVKKRIICLSDGCDTTSTRDHFQICETIKNSRVIVDSFCLGAEENEELRTLSLMSGGYKFVPETLDQAMAICEMEPVLNLLDRPLKTLPSVRELICGHVSADPDVVTRDVFPERKQHPSLKDSFIALSTFQTTSQESTSPNTFSTTVPRNNDKVYKDRSNANQRPARLMAEIRKLNATPHPRYEVFISESNMGFWKILMQGPPEGPYAEGVWLLYLHMEEDYPALPPKARFVTPVLHPNINRHGRVCHSILDRNWTADTSNSQILNTIYSLLLVPEFSDPINAVVTLNFHWDEVAFQEEVKEHIRKHASTGKEALRAKILGAGQS